MDNHLFLLTLGALLLLGLLADQVGRRTRLPRVTLLIIFGIALGSSGFDLLPKALTQWYELVASIALTMVAFLLGSSLSSAQLNSRGREIFMVSLCVVLLTAMILFAGLLLAGASMPLALILSGIATATAPAATHDVLRQTGAQGPFTDVLRGIVAVDDAWGLILFSLLLVAAGTILGNGDLGELYRGAWELGGAIVVGLGVGLPAAYLTGRLESGEPLQSEALGVVLLCAGLAVWLEVSFLLAGIVAGALIANFAKHHTRAFHEIENVEWPFMVMFFILSGAALKMEAFGPVSGLAFLYIALRLTARIGAAWVGGTLAGMDTLHRRWMGLALTPQAGVALGMALVAGAALPDLKETILSVTIATTIAFELAGPLMTRVALEKVGEAHPAD